MSNSHSPCERHSPVISSLPSLMLMDAPLVPSETPDSVISTEAHEVFTLTVLPSIFTELCEGLELHDHSTQRQNIQIVEEIIFIKVFNR